MKALMMTLDVQDFQQYDIRNAPPWCPNASEPVGEEDVARQHTASLHIPDVVPDQQPSALKRRPFRTRVMLLQYALHVTQRFTSLRGLISAICLCGPLALRAVQGMTFSTAMRNEVVLSWRACWMQEPGAGKPPIPAGAVH